jgi:hypothetical protein
MIPGQVNWTAPSNPLDVSGRWTGSGSAANGDNGESTFALLYETILAFSD